MQTTLAQTLALTLYGNAAGSGFSIKGFWPGATVFQFCRQVSFVRSGLLGTRTVASDPAVWLRSLLDHGRTLTLHHARGHGDLPGWMTVGFANGGSRWIIEEVGQNGGVCWEPEWRVWNVDSPDRRIWDVAYRRVERPAGLTPPRLRAIDAVAADLEERFGEIADFARRAGADNFADIFDRGARALTQPPVGDSGYREILAPPGYLSAPAAALITAVQTGWVFGGMGSWNDGAYGGILEAEGEALSSSLFALFEEAMVTVGNFKP